MAERVLAFGELMLRLSPPAGKRLLQGGQLESCFGGAEANVAVSLVNFGLDTAFVTKLPKNPIGDAALRSLRAFGVDTSWILRGGERLGLYYYEPGAGPRSSICTYDRAHSSFSETMPEDWDWSALLEGVDWLHLSGITPSLNQGLTQACLEASAEAHRRGIRVSVDLNYRSTLWPRERASEVMSILCQNAHLCISNEDEARILFGIEASSSNAAEGRINREGYAEVARRLRDRFGCGNVALSLRTSHSATANDWAGLLYDGRQMYHSREYTLDHIVDRVGSGDSFAAGLIFSLLRGFDGQRAVDFAVAASALKHSIAGDFNLVTFAEAEALADGPATGRIRR